MPEAPPGKVRSHPFRRPAHDPSCLRAFVPSCLPEYAELCVTSNFTFLTGASHPDELVEQAASLGYRSNGSIAHAVARVERGNDDLQETARRIQNLLTKSSSTIDYWRSDPVGRAKC